MSHHPTSAELADMRRKLTSAPSSGMFSVLTRDGWITHPTIGGAWAHEKRDGIGSRGFLAGASASFDRREASALRSRTYARMDYCACQHPDRHYGNLPCRVTPESSGIPLGPNGYCWSCWSAKHDQTIPTDTWTEDEPHSPLPVRYQPSFIITR